MRTSNTKPALYMTALLYHADDRLQSLIEKQIAASGLPPKLISEILTLATTCVLGERRIQPNRDFDRPSHSIFQYIGNQDFTYQYPKRSLVLGQKAFPKVTIEEDGTAAIQWQALKKDLEQLANNTHLTNRAESTLQLLHQHCSCLPAPVQHASYISYYDYAKSLAGFSVAIYDYLLANEGLATGFQIAETEACLLLVKGDLSGVQSFLYDIVGRSAARNLKGRSFYLQLLSSSILQHFLNELQLYHCHVIYDSGGSFQLIAPNTPLVREKLAQLKASIAEKLFETHKTSLSLLVAAVPVTLSDLMDASLKQITDRLNEAIEKEKLQKQNHLLLKDAAQFFEPEKVEEGGGHPRDMITGEEIPVVKKAWVMGEEGAPQPIAKHKNADDTRLVTAATAQQIIVGKNLRQVKYWISSDEALTLPEEEKYSDYVIDPCGIGVFNYLIPDKDLAAFLSVLKQKTVRIYKINAPSNFLEPTKFGNHHAFGFLLYGGNDFPGDDYMPFTFSELAGMIERDKQKLYQRNRWGAYPIAEISLKRLSFLRMDVDNLGKVFQNESDQIQNLVTYSTLSRSLDFFFKGYLNTIWEAEGKFKFRAQIIYSGGDDLFIIGRWNNMIDFAKAIKAAFQDWVCHNESISISGGTAILPPKFPTMKGAQLAGEAEHSAKKHQNAALKKNTFSLLGLPLHWGDQEDWVNEFELVEDLKNQLINFVTYRKLSRNFLQKIQTLYSMSLQQKASEKNESWKWIITYDLAKAKQAKRRDQAIKSFLDQLQESTLFNRLNGQKFKSPHDYIALLNVAARWAELETKTYSVTTKSMFGA